MEKTILTVAVIALLGATLFLLKEKQSENQVFLSNVPPQVYDLYNDWKHKYNRKYASTQEDQYRLNVFYTNYQTIQSFYEGPEQSYTLDFTQFMDITNEEFTSIYLGLIPHESYNPEAPDILGSVANGVDWKAQGYVGPVKNQGQCGSCWAFSTVGALEGLSKAKGSLQSFSEQQLVDCSSGSKWQNQGCNGGVMAYALNFVKANGITSEDSYPYKAVQGTCKIASGSFKINGYSEGKDGDCASLQKLAQQGVVGVAVDASNFQFYGGGIFSNCQKSLNHGVTLVAFDASSWTIKNSWGASWGEAGYIRLASGNTCGVCNSMAVLPQ